MVGLLVPTPKNVADFQKLYLRKYGIKLCFDEAHEAMARLMQFVYLMDETALSNDSHGDT